MSGDSYSKESRNRQQEREYNRRPEVMARKKEWGRRNPKKYNASRRKIVYQLRLDVLIAYGSNPPKCMCECGCSENRVPLLDIDHVNNDGADHRRSLCNGKRESGNAFYWKLKKLGWPKNVPLRVLCVKCNVGRQRNGGQCVELGIIPIEENRMASSARRNVPKKVEKAELFDLIE